MALLCRGLAYCQFRDYRQKIEMTSKHRSLNNVFWGVVAGRIGRGRQATSTPRRHDESFHNNSTRRQHHESFPIVKTFVVSSWCHTVSRRPSVVQLAARGPIRPLTSSNPARDYPPENVVHRPVF